MQIYPRHAKGCSHKDRCSCPLWADGLLHGRRRRLSLQTRSWAEAERKVKELEAGQGATPLKEAIYSFLDACAHKAASTQSNYKNALKKFSGALIDGRPLSSTSDLRPEVLERWFASQQRMAPNTLASLLAVVRTFCRYCLRRRWLTEDPTGGLVARIPTPMAEPFSDDEMSRILAASGPLRALILTFACTGLRIGDVTHLRREQVDLATGKVFLRMTKTRKPVTTLLPPTAREALAAWPAASERFFFWDGKGTYMAACQRVRAQVMGVLRGAGIVKGYPHRFRDTFACKLLEKGVPVRDVQILLGHSTVATTERHYADFLPSHQAKVERAAEVLGF